MTSLRKHWKYIRNLKIVSVLLCILGIHWTQNAGTSFALMTG